MELHERITQPAEEVRHPLHDPFAEVKDRVHRGLIEDLGRQIFNTAIDPETLRARIGAEIAARLSQEPGISHEDREKLAAALVDDILGHGPLERLLPTTRSPRSWSTARKTSTRAQRHLQKTPVRFTDESHLRRVIARSSPSRAAHGRVHADGGRAPGRRQPRQRHHPAAVA